MLENTFVAFVIFIVFHVNKFHRHLFCVELSCIDMGEGGNVGVMWEKGMMWEKSHLGEGSDLG